MRKAIPLLFLIAASVSGATVNVVATDAATRQPLQSAYTRLVHGLLLAPV